MRYRCVLEFNSWKSRCVGRGRGGGCAEGPVGRCDNGKELTELRHTLYLTSHREHVMGEMVFVVLRPVVWSKESLNVTLRTLDGISVISGVGTDERD